MKKILIISLLFLYSCNSNLPLNIGNGYILNYDRNSFFAVFNDEEYIIKGEILELNYDSTYIFAKIKPIDKILETINKKNLNYQQQQDIIKYSPIREYWIVNKKIKSELIMTDFGYSLSNVYGPFDYTQFKIKKKEFKISSELKTVEKILKN